MAALMTQLGVPVTAETIRRWESGDATPRDEHAVAYRQLLETLEEAKQ
jgi:hypothetical protein